MTRALPEPPTTLAARDDARAPSSLAGLLKLLLSMPEDAPVFATPSFGDWLAAGEQPAWPPPRGARAGLALVDTRDRVARDPDAWRRLAESPAIDAALVLSGSGAPGSAARRLLRRLRRPGTRRVDESRVASALFGAGAPPAARLAFEDDLEVPTDFAVGADPRSTGAAFLVGRVDPFSGPLWSSVGDFLGDPAFTVEGLQLRLRGAAVVTVRAGGREYVVRIVPPGGGQEVVRRNHSGLVELRRALAARPALLRLVPDPVFAESHGPVLLLGETRLAGTLAWKVASGALAPALHGNALAFLAALRDATVDAAPSDRDGLARLFDEDLARLDGAAFVGDSVRRMLGGELRAAAGALAEIEVRRHTSHGDFGYGNVLVDARDGRIEGVIDWDTARISDLPGVDRVNLEIQIRRVDFRESFPEAVESVWRGGAARDVLEGPGGPARARALFGVGVCRYVLRSLSYPAVYREESAGYERALAWLSRTGPAAGAPSA